MDFKNLKNASHKLNMACSIFIRLYTVLSKIVFSWCFMSKSTATVMSGESVVNLATLLIMHCHYFLSNVTFSVYEKVHCRTIMQPVEHLCD